MIETKLTERLKSFIEGEGKSCSMDIGGITPEYVYRMWGGSASLEEIAQGLTKLRKQGHTECGIRDLRNDGITEAQSAM